MRVTNKVNGHSRRTPGVKRARHAASCRAFAGSNMRRHILRNPGSLLPRSSFILGFMESSMKTALLFPSLLLSLMCSVSWAQEYTVRPIRIVVPFAPGGGTDLMARIFAQKMTETWGQPAVVENRAGGTGAVGSTIVMKAPPDGYTLLLITSSTHAIWPAIETNLPYHPVRDFAAVSLSATGPQVLVVHPSVPANSVKELVALAKARPGALNYASPGSGTAGHMTGELFKSVTGTKITHVPYKGAGSVITDLLSGYVQMSFSGPGAVMPHINARKLKALAVAYPRRTAGLEQVPTFIEAGYSGVDAAQWYGVLTTGGTP